MTVPTAASAPVVDPFAALGDPNRRAIVELLGAGGRRPA
jgi:DNA-binding transcriptional ArsR family regulator